MYTITLSDGTVLGNLELNGNNYISETLIDDAVFDGTLETVEIHDGEQTQIYQNMKLVANRVFDGKSWFILAEKTPQDIEKEKTNKRIEALEKASGTGREAETGISSRLDDLENRIKALEDKA